MKKLEGKIALVAGATRGAGRGIATALGEQGATVYCTGRSVRGAPAMKSRPESIEETAELVTARGGRGIAVQVDHTQPEQVAKLFEQIEHLDILVNDIWGGDDLTRWGKKFWEVDLNDGLTMLDRAIRTHIITSWHAVPKMKRGGLIVEITDGDGYYYRGNFFYDLVKTSVIRMAFTQAFDLRKQGIHAIAVTPGYLRSEWMLSHYGVTEENWRDVIPGNPSFAASETPLFVGRCIAALATDPDVAKKNGRVFASWDLAEECEVDDADGTRPHFRRWLEANMPEYAWKRCDEGFYSYCDSRIVELMEAIPEKG
jgi:NAD(P)-dependent dehydrogenase (short-subunit alcohol dehydrogenase family)